MEKPTTLLILVIAGLAIAMTGCNEDQRLAEMARDATQRQAEQNREMAQLNREVALSNKRLIEGDAQARQEVLQVQRELVERDAEGRQDLNALQREVQAAVSEERSSLDRQQEGLEKERREIAKQRNRDPILAAAITGLGLVLACLAPVVLAVYLLRAVHHQEPSDADLADLLVQEIASDRSVLFGPGDRDRPCLGHEDLTPRPPPASEDDSQEAEPPEA